MHLGQRIKHLIESAGITQSELADELGLLQGAISKIYKKQDFNVSILIKISNVLGLTIDEILQDENIYNNTAE